jgi:hypothetical protein
VPALAALIRRRPRGWDALVVALAVGWLNATYVALTMHGWWWPGRQTVVVLPCAVLAIAWWAQAYPPARVLVAVGGLIGALVAGWLVVDVLAGHITLVVDFARTTNPVYRAWRTALPDGVLLPAGTAVLRVTWIAVTGALAAWGVWTVRAGPRPSSRPGRARALSQAPGSSPTPRPRSMSRA